jgi:23S rRNA pseudouridine1911/1915/1917 synthase
VAHSETVSAEDIPLDIIYEDRWLLAVSKPPDLVVHPSKGHQRGTLINALLYHCQKLSSEGGPLRPGIVHRLDRDTSGVMVVVKDESVHQQIARQFHDRKVLKEYVAVCEGKIELDSDLIEAPLGPHLRDREKMAVRHDVGREASTTYEVVERLAGFSVVRCFPHSGRTHQIRVHLRHIGHPIVADALYGHRDAIYLSELTGEEPHPSEEPLLERQALHARRLTIYHPALRREMTFEVEVPEDMMRLVRALRERWPAISDQ